jgi:hypothetical protein
VQIPHIKHSLQDPQSGTLYHVMAYRQLSRMETVNAIRFYLSQKRSRKKLASVTIISTIGAS